MLRITFFVHSGAIFSHEIRPGSVNTIDLTAPMLITKIVVADDGQPLFERVDAPEPMDVEEALTVLTDFVREHTEEPEGYPDSAPEPPDSERE